MANILTFPISLILNGTSGTDFGVAVDLDGAEVTGTLPANKGGTGVANNVAATLTRSGNHALTITTSGTANLSIGTGGTLGTAAYTASTAYDAAGAAAAVTPTTLGLVIGTNVQAYDSDLTTWAGVTPGTGVTTALAVNTGSAGSFAINGVTAGTSVQTDQVVTAWTRATTTTLGTTLNGTLSDTSTTITAFAGVAGVTYHCRCLGAGAITHHATDLIITQTGASIAATAAGDTFDVEMLTATTCRIKNYEKADGKPLFNLIASSISDSDTTHAPDGNSVFDALALKAPLASPTFTGNASFAETTDTVYTITDGAAFEIDPANGNVQIITLGASRTPAATNFAAGQTVLLGIDDGTAYAITWTTVAPTWVKVGGTGVAPTLATSGYTWILLWKVATTIYGCEVGKP